MTLLSCGGGETDGEAESAGGGGAAARHLAYVPSTDGAVHIFEIDDSTGILTPKGDPSLLPPAGLVAMAADPQGKFIYVSVVGQNAIAALAVNQDTGSLTNAGTAPMSRVGEPIVVHPSGTFLYALASVSSSVIGCTIGPFSIDRTSGALTPVAGAAVTLPESCGDLAIDPAGENLYFTSLAQRTLRGYRVSSADGGLTPVAGSPWSSPTYPRGIAIDAGGRFLYTADDLQDVLSAYRIDRGSGALTRVPGSPFRDGAGTRPMSAVTDRAGRFLFVTHYHSDTIAGYSVDQATGALTRVSGAATDVSPSLLSDRTATVHPNGRFVYGMDKGGRHITAYALDPSTGTLAAVSGGAVSTQLGSLVGMAIVELPPAR